MEEEPNSYRQNFIKELINLSKAKQYKEAIKEWRLQNVIYDEDGTRCICNKYIHYLCHIINIKNGKMTIIGSHCCNHIEKSIEKQAKERIDKLKNPHKWCRFCNNKKNKVRNEEIYYCKNCNANNIMNVGKHKGLLFCDIYDNHKSYCNWVLKQKDAYGDLLKFKHFLLSCRSN